MTIRPAEPPPVADRERGGPMCGTCPAVRASRPCTDCALRAGTHTRGFPPPSSALLPTNPPRWTVLVVVSSVVTLFLLGSLLTAVDRSVFNATHAVDDFFSALAARDSTRSVSSLLNSQAVITTAAMIKDPGYTPPTSWRVAEESGDFRAARVKVSYTVAGRQQSATWSLSRIGSRGGVFSRWAIDAGLTSLPSLNVRMPSSGLVVAGGLVAAEVDLSRTPVLPGVYQVKTPDNPIFDLDEQVPAAPIDLRTEAPDSAYPPVSPVLKKGAESTVRAALKDELRGCAAQTEAAPGGCPFIASACSDSDEFNWSVDVVPQISLTQEPAPDDVQFPGGFARVLLNGTSSGTMTYTATCNGGSYYSGLVPIELDGWEVATSGKSVTLTQGAGE